MCWWDNLPFLVLKRTEKQLIEEQLTSWRHPYTSPSPINIRYVGVFVSNSAGAYVQVIFVSHSYNLIYLAFRELAFLRVGCVTT